MIFERRYLNSRRLRIWRTRAARSRQTFTLTHRFASHKAGTDRQSERFTKSGDSPSAIRTGWVQIVCPYLAVLVKVSRALTQFAGGIRHNKGFLVITASAQTLPSLLVSDLFRSWSISATNTVFGLTSCNTQDRGSAGRLCGGRLESGRSLEECGMSFKTPPTSREL